jgi:hypothetical protein
MQENLNNDLQNLNKDLTIFGKVYVDKLKKLNVYIQGLRGVNKAFKKRKIFLNKNIYYILRNKKYS